MHTEAEPNQCYVEKKWGGWDPSMVKWELAFYFFTELSAYPSLHIGPVSKSKVKTLIQFI